MGMVVRTNTMSTNAYRQLGMNNSAVTKSLEKLSSGYRINRAGDDASGLAISEKMKAQINGLEQASANSQDGISLIQTAEGATTEIHNMLNRMVTLATKSANGTIQNEVDRKAIQTEVDALNKEITRIAKATNFNGINLLDGSLSTASTASGTFGTVDVSFSTNSKVVDLGTAHTVQLKADTAKDPGISVSITPETGAILITLGSKADSTYKAEDIAQAVRDQAAAEYAKVANNSAKATDAKMYQALTSFSMDATGAISLKANDDSDTGVLTLKDTAALGGLTLQVGDTNAEYNHVTVSVDNMTAEGLGVSSLNVSTQESAASSINAIKAAINKVSTNRGNLGALQNRLEYTINNLDTTNENMTAANSRIRDTDMAKEMMNYTKMNILTQAAQAMLAQANQQPQSILQLLQ